MSVRKRILIISLMVMVFASMQVVNVKEATATAFLDELPPYGDKSELTTGGGLTEVNLDIGNMTLWTLAEFVDVSSSSTALIYMWKDEYIWEDISSITSYYNYSAKGEIRAQGFAALASASLEIYVYDPSGNRIRTIPLFDEDAEINEVIPIDKSEAWYDDPLSTPSAGMYTIEVCFAASSVVAVVGLAEVDFLMVEGYGAQVSMTIYASGIAQHPEYDEWTELMVGTPLEPYYSIEVPGWG